MADVRLGWLMSITSIFQCTCQHTPVMEDQLGDFPLTYACPNVDCSMFMFTIVKWAVH